MFANFWKAVPGCSWVISLSGGIVLNNNCRYKFSLVLFNSFFIFFYYSYEQHLQIFERLHPALMSFHLFYLIFFFIFSIIATKHICIYKFLKGCTQPFSSYIAYNIPITNKSTLARVGWVIVMGIDGLWSSQWWYAHFLLHLNNFGSMG